MPFIITPKHEHPRGKVYAITATRTQISLLFTFHALERMKRWDLTDEMVVDALLDPEEVLNGHRGRFIAHRRRPVIS